MFRAKTNFHLSRQKKFFYFLPILASILLLGYVLFLIHLVYTSQKRLQLFVLDGFLFEVKYQAHHLGYFFSERKQDVQVLAADRTVHAYFQNKALGMTMAYGLKGTLYNINARLQKYIHKRTFKGQRIYTRMVLIDQESTVLADTQCDDLKKLGEIKWTRPIQHIPHVFLAPDQEDKSLLLVASPCIFKNKFSGWLLAWIKWEDIFKYFLKVFQPSHHEGQRLVGLTSDSHTVVLFGEHGNIIQEKIAFTLLKQRKAGEEWSKLNSNKTSSLANLPLNKVLWGKLVINGQEEKTIIAYGTPVPDTSFILWELVEPDRIIGAFKPKGLLSALVVLSLCILGATVFIIFITFHQIEMRVRYIDLLQKKNKQLEEEIRKREAVEKQLMAAKLEAEEAANKLANALEESEKLREVAEAATKAKSQFLTNMSHEIRTPLNAVIGMVHLLSHTPLNKDQKEYLTMLRVSADSLLEIINNILDISKIEAGKFELEEREFNLREMVEALSAALAEGAHRKRLEFFCYIPANVPNYVIGDEVKLKQVLANLINNAIKFTEKGQIVVKVEKLNQEDEIELLFSVADTGIGIPKEKLKEIFETFTQADASITRKYGGTGLGLAISKQIVEMMGGRIWVESEVGKGSTFYFTARFKKGKEEKQTIPPLFQELKVLIVDDKSINRLILGEMLNAWGIEYEEACNSLSALEKLKAAVENNKPFNLILLDEWMPGINGVELAWQIRSMKAYNDIPIIFITFAESEETKRRAETLGISYYIARPIRRSQLYETIIEATGFKKEEETEKEKSKLTGVALKILVVEDNLINQKFIVRLLEKQGWQVKVANNGKEALKMIEEAEFDIVLMDIQMPEMDGFTATKIIREREKKTGRHLPIIALTAHAFAKDRKRCLEAGMDGYVSKPIQIKELWQVIEELYGKFKTRKIDTTKVSSCIDLNRAIKMADGDRKFLKELLYLFLDDCSQKLTEIKKAIAQNDIQAIAKTVHTLKSSSGNLGLNRIYELCLEIERQAKEGNLENMESLYESFRKEFEEVRQFVFQFN